MKSALIEKVAPKVGSDTYENNDRFFFFFFYYVLTTHQILR